MTVIKQKKHLGNMEQQLQFEEAEKILVGQMSDEEKAVALKREFEQISDEEVGSLIKQALEKMVENVKLFIKQISEERTGKLVKICFELASKREFEQKSDEEVGSLIKQLVENEELFIKQISEEQTGKCVKNYIEHSSKENLAVLIKFILKN